MMLKFPLGSNRNSSFLDTPSLSDHIYMVSCGILQPENLQHPRAGEMHCKANNEPKCTWIESPCGY